jgi:hypothetical protein
MNLTPIGAQKSGCAIATCYNWIIGPYFRLVRLTFDLAPLEGASLWVVGSQGWKPGLSPPAPSGRRFPRRDLIQMSKLQSPCEAKTILISPCLWRLWERGMWRWRRGIGGRQPSLLSETEIIDALSSPSRARAQGFVLAFAASKSKL